MFKLALPILLINCGLAQAKNNVDAKQLPGTWLCQTSFSTNSNSTNSISSRAVYAANGTVTHADQWTQTLKSGESIVMQTNLTGRWRFEPSSNMLFETTNSANVSYDPKNQLANTVGAQTQRLYQDRLYKEQASLAVRLNNAEWIAMLGNKSSNPIVINCTRG